MSDARFDPKEEKAPAESLDEQIRKHLSSKALPVDGLTVSDVNDLVAATGASRKSVLRSLWRIAGPNERVFSLAIDTSDGRNDVRLVAQGLVDGGDLSWPVVCDSAASSSFAVRELVKALIGILMNADRIGAARELLESAAVAQVHPGESASANVLIAMVKVGDVEMAVETWKRLHELVNLGTDVIQTGRLLDAIAKVPRPDLVESILHSIEETVQGLNPVLTATWVKAYQLAGDTDKTLAAFKASEVHNSYHVNSVLLALVNDRRVDDAVSVVDSEPNENLRALELANVAALVAESRANELEPFLDRLATRDLLAPSIVETVAETLARNKSWRQVARLLDVSENCGIEPLPGTVGRAIGGLARAGDGRLALSVARRYGYGESQALHPILECAVRHDDRSLAIDAVTFMVASGVEPSIDDLMSVSRCYRGTLGNVGENFSAIRTANAARGQNHHSRKVPNARIRSLFILAVAVAYAQTRQTASLRDVLRQFEGWDVRVESNDLVTAVQLASDGGANAVAEFMVILGSTDPFASKLDREGGRKVWRRALLCFAREGRPDLVFRHGGVVGRKSEFWDCVNLATEYRYLLHGTPIDKQERFVRPEDISVSADFPNGQELLLLRTAREEGCVPEDVSERLLKCTPPIPPLVAETLAPLASTTSQLESIVRIVASGRDDAKEFRDALLAGRQRLGMAVSSEPLLQSLEKALGPSPLEIEWFAESTFPEENLRRLFRSILETHGGRNATSVGILRAVCRTLAIARDRNRMESVIERFEGVGVEPDAGIWMSVVESCRSFSEARSVLDRLAIEEIDASLIIAAVKAFGNDDDLSGLDNYVLELVHQLRPHDVAQVLANLVKKHAERTDLAGIEWILAEAESRGLDLGAGARRAVLLARRRANVIDDRELRAELSETDRVEQLDPSDQIRHIVHDLTNLTGPLFQDLREFRFAVETGDFTDAQSIAESAAATQESLKRLIDHWKLVAEPPVEGSDGGRASVVWVMERIKELLHDRLEQSAIELAVSLPRLPTGRPAEVAMSVEQLDIVLRNLINNSVKALRGSSNGRIEVASAYIDYLEDLGPSFTDGWLIVTVRDNGPGIDSRYIDSIQTGGVTFDPQGGGLGWGLNLVFRIVESIGGKIAVRSRTKLESSDQDSFTEFELALPIAMTTVAGQ